MLNLFCTNSIKGKEHCWRDFMKYTFDIVNCQDTCEPICFKLGMLRNTTKLYSLVSVWMILMLTEGHMDEGKPEIVLSLCYKVA